MHSASPFLKNLAYQMKRIKKSSDCKTVSQPGEETGIGHDQKRGAEFSINACL
jgi:hypothetical protein